VNSNLLSKLTIVIPTYNRQSYALRNMRYWSDYGATVHVLDGSSLAISELELASLTNKICYHHLPISISERLKLAVDFVVTEYSVMMGDDEFFVPSALESCISELDSNPELVSCMGRCLAFNNSLNGVVGWIAYPEMEDYAILQDDPMQRMVAHMNPYTCSTIYAVTRTPVWKMAMSTIGRREFSPFNLNEIQFELVICYQGKSKVIPTLLWLRSSENVPIRDLEKMPRDKNYLVEGWWLNTSKKAEHIEFLKIMSDALAKNDDQVKRVIVGVVQGIDSYVHERLALMTTRSKLRAKVSSLLPEVIKSIMRNLRNRVRPAHNPTNFNSPLSIAANNLHNRGVEVDFEALAAIEAIVMAFHNDQ
jgi:glycosyltransferase domain-containing protein